MEDYKIILQRQMRYENVTKPNNSKVEHSTLGKLDVCKIVNSQGILKSIYTCYTCENDGPSTDIPNQDKRIVARSYKLEWTDSQRNGALAKKFPEYKSGSLNKAIWLTCDDVLPKFRNRRILIHVGNYPQDTAGCILLGKSQGRGVVNQSVDACKEFFDLMMKIGIENAELIVKEIEDEETPMQPCDGQE